MKTCSCNKREQFPFKASFMDNGFEHIVSFSPGYTCERWLADRNDGGNHGNGCVDLIFLVRNEQGAVQFRILTGWYFDWHERKGRTGLGANPMPSDLGYHSPKPHYDGQPILTDSCPIIGDVPCYYDGSTLNAEEPFNILVRQGETALWKFLEGYHKGTFNS